MQPEVGTEAPLTKGCGEICPEQGPWVAPVEGIVGRRRLVFGAVCNFHGPSLNDSTPGVKTGVGKVDLAKARLRREAIWRR